MNIQESRETVAAWAKEKRLSVTVVLDPSGSLTRAYGVAVTPTVFLVGRDGKLAAKGFGTKPWTSASGRALLEALLGP